MPRAEKSSRSRRAVPTSARRPAASSIRTLLIIDNAPLQRVAWAEFHSALKRLEKSARQLQRHEEVDRLEYESWLHRTFPVFITRLRQLHEEVFLKGTRINAVQTMHYFTGRSLKKLWHDHKQHEANPEGFENEFKAEEDEAEEEAEAQAQEQAGDFFGAQDGFSSKRSRDETSNEIPLRPQPRPPSSDASQGLKEIYRRLVEHLHPDCGGEWTATRKRLWHEVQQAWAARDADWLSRLEIDWETANDVLRPHSPLSRLRRAVEALHGARRDTERKLREYRESPAWRFTEQEKDRPLLHRRTEENFKHDLNMLQRQLDYFNATIAAWERSPRSSQRKRATSSWDESER